MFALDSCKIAYEKIKSHLKQSAEMCLIAIHLAVYDKRSLIW